MSSRATTPTPFSAVLAEAVSSGDRRALARAISLVENEVPASEPLLTQLFPRTGRASIVGVTGPPGAGKSTLVDAMVKEIRASGQTVAIIAVDPTSPFSGGAVLGDRVRMTAHANDSGVFVRSMATRGHLGGTARATSDVALVLDAAGFDVIIIETVGVGQDEVDIVGTADVSLVVLFPGSGDDVQAIKAGIMEIADVFVVNKADREGADQVVHAIRSAQSLGAERASVPVLKTIATTGEGVGALWNQVNDLRQHARMQRDARRRRREETRLRDLIAGRYRELFERMVPSQALAEAVDEVLAHRRDPYSVAAELFERSMEPGIRR